MIEPKPYKRGNALLASQIETHRKATVMNVTSGAGVTCSRVGNNVTIGVTQGAPVNAAQPYRVMSVGDDHLVCQAWDWDTATASGVNVNVAKPYGLRKSTSDGTTQNGITYTFTNGYTRTADDGDEETQIIVPAYDLYDDNIIMVSVGNTGVTVGEERLILKDDNDDARAWAKQNG